MNKLNSKRSTQEKPSQPSRNAKDSRACDFCRRRKIKCETKLGAEICTLCSRLKKSCTYNDPVLKRGPKGTRKGSLAISNPNEKSFHIVSNSKTSPTPYKLNSISHQNYEPKPPSSTNYSSSVRLDSPIKKSPTDGYHHVSQDNYHSVPQGNRQSNSQKNYHFNSQDSRYITPPDNCHNIPQQNHRYTQREVSNHVEHDHHRRQHDNGQYRPLENQYPVQQEGHHSLTAGNYNPVQNSHHSEQRDTRTPIQQGYHHYEHQRNYESRQPEIYHSSLQEGHRHIYKDYHRPSQQDHHHSNHHFDESKEKRILPPPTRESPPLVRNHSSSLEFKVHTGRSQPQKVNSVSSSAPFPTPNSILSVSPTDSNLPPPYKRSPLPPPPSTTRSPSEPGSQQQLDEAYHLLHRHREAWCIDGEAIEFILAFFKHFGPHHPLVPLPLFLSLLHHPTPPPHFPLLINTLCCYYLQRGPHPATPHQYQYYHRQAHRHLPPPTDPSVQILTGSLLLLGQIDGHQSYPQNLPHHPPPS